MKKKTIYPESCPSCWLSERQGSLYGCKFYGLAHQTTLEGKPAYCKVKSITVEEEETIENPGRSQ